MSKVLELVFKDTAGKDKTISVDAPREDVTKSEAESAMQKVIAANVFATTNGDLATISEARMRTTTVEALA
ncbi:MAG TPA: DUF2922 domain-containing protein [Candidatus Avacidaminococcus intestinavium]|uniref:DUF2922 domain-containing protein n=1 Tax=Candidatus Avacidaminococcus intestinavium TaxID=2840684 RepID=A0A9D1SKL4_9FIRM|nr:DUF2922 domain-containing protein [Candidatus Avacidaminococcus intestinavium]